MIDKVYQYHIWRFGVNQLPAMQEAINACIDGGWEVHGQLHMARIDNQQVFVQAMVKYAD